MIEIFIALLLGCLAGIITGLIPGVHINLVAILVLSFSGILLLHTSPIALAVFILSMSLLHTFTDSCPSIFLGAPDSDTALTVLPGHKLMLEGRGYEAVKLTVIGSFLGLILTIILIPIFIPTVGKIYPIISEYIVYILIISSLFLILRDTNSKTWALIIFLMAGSLGLGVLNIPTLKQPLFPMLSGLFGTSGLFISLKDKVKIPEQKITKANVSKKEISQALGGGIVASSLSGFLPGLGAAQAAIIASSFLKKMSTEGFLVLVGSINTIVMMISFVALYVIDKARNGSVIAISKLLENFTIGTFTLFIGVALIVGAIATVVTLNIAKIFSKIMTKLSYQKIIISIIILIIVLTYIFSSWIGLLILTVSTAVGVIPPLKGIGRNHLMDPHRPYIDEI
ncbi:MAG: tripartite tricarboxylate transporter permease, partial [Nanoarchaeota archaeon]|nr:tripartite tricarboxylate transporter permease [Nanoarchaeota archaeon]